MYTLYIENIFYLYITHSDERARTDDVLGSAAQAECVLHRQNLFSIYNVYTDTDDVLGSAAQAGGQRKRARAASRICCRCATSRPVPPGCDAHMSFTCSHSDGKVCVGESGAEGGDPLPFALFPSLCLPLAVVLPGSDVCDHVCVRWLNIAQKLSSFFIFYFSFFFVQTCVIKCVSGGCKKPICGSIIACPERFSRGLALHYQVFFF